MKVIEIVCRSEKQRSPTFRRVLNKLFKMYGDKGYRARSSGILENDSRERKIRQLTPQDVDRAHKVVAVDDMVGEALQKRFSGLEAPKYIQLSIPDVYERDSPALIQKVEDFYLSDVWK
jgi:predicted protein tyrosine phosphatase